MSNNLNYYWLAGFTTGEGSFLICIHKSSTYKLGYFVRLRVSITQHYRDELLMNYLVKVLKCGNIYSNKATVQFQVSNFNDIIHKMIPFFHLYEIEGEKNKDFEDFCKVA